MAASLLLAGVAEFGKMLAHTLGVFLNLQLRRPPLDIDGLVVV
jgi:hypothetical protein